MNHDTSASESDPGPMRPPDAFDMRTLNALAWRRTALRVALVSVAGAQLLALYYGPTAYVVAALGLTAALIMHLSVSHRYIAVSRGVRYGYEDAGIARAEVRVMALSVFATLAALTVLGWMMTAALAS